MHDVIKEKVSSPFTNGANLQKGEGIRGKGNLFITNILEKLLKVNPSGENISYSPAGDTSSAAFKRWFKNSPFKNEDGTPKVYYHGAKKGGGFTVFRDWQYFTDKR